MDRLFIRLDVGFECCRCCSKTNLLAGQAAGAGGISQLTMEIAQKRTDQIVRKKQYGWRIDGKIVHTNPTQQLIDEAIKKNELEQRGLQEYESSLFHEWDRVPSLDRARAVQQYHSRRVAFFCVNGWEEPIKICVHDVLEDGAHRLLAARHRKLETIDCIIVKCGKCKKGPTN
jgi:hypothetical protein